MLNFDIPMTALVFFALFGMMSLTMIVAAIIAKALHVGFGIYDRRQYVKDIAGMFRE